MQLLQSSDNFSTQSERSLFAWISQYREEYSRNCVLEVERQGALEMRKDARRELRAGVVGRPWTYREFRQLKQVSRIVERSELSNELYKYSTKKFPIRAEVLANGKVGKLPGGSLLIYKSLARQQGPCSMDTVAAGIWLPCLNC